MLAIDCDFKRIHAYEHQNGVLLSGGTFGDLRRILENRASRSDLRILFEIAGPAYAKNNSQAAMYNLGKWMRYNCLVAGWLFATYPEALLVAPSSEWTMGYDVKVRHSLAEATARTKDLRECEAMLWSYSVKPVLWKPLTHYL